MAKILVRSTKPNIPSAEVEVEHVTDQELQRIYHQLDRLTSAEPQASDAVAKAFVYAVTLCPKANPSDVWQHVIYRRLLDRGITDQQWKRISGYALERVFPSIYNPRLDSAGVRFRSASRSEMEQILAQIDLIGTVKLDKIDLLLEGRSGERWCFFGGAHAKASIAERIQDDVPTSVALMEKGFVSIMLTMDSKSFPPPHGNGVNRGELMVGSANDDRERPKRAYIEEDGQFDALFSFNLRTPPSSPYTPSGKRIFTLGMHERQPDSLVQFLISTWSDWQGKNLEP